MLFTATEPTVNAALLLLKLPTVILMAPVVAEAGTLATICVSLQLEAVAATLLKVIVLEPCEEPKPLPVIVTALLTGPARGEKPFTNRLATVNADDVEVRPPTVTLTAPLVVPAETMPVIKLSDQVATEIILFPMAAVLLPCVSPNPVPLIWICAPTEPPEGANPEMAGFRSVNRRSLFPSTPLMTTRMKLVTAPVGTAATICVSLQELTLRRELPIKMMLEPWVA